MEIGGVWATTVPLDMWVGSLKLRHIYWRRWYLNGMGQRKSAIWRDITCACPHEILKPKDLWPELLTSSSASAGMVSFAWIEAIMFSIDLTVKWANILSCAALLFVNWSLTCCMSKATHYLPFTVSPKCRAGPDLATVPWLLVH